MDRRLWSALKEAAFRRAPIIPKVTCAPAIATEILMADTDSSHSADSLKKSLHGIDTVSEGVESPSCDLDPSAQCSHPQNPPLAAEPSVSQCDIKGSVKNGISQASPPPEAPCSGGSRPSRPLQAPKSKGRRGARKALSIGMNYTLLEQDKLLNFAVRDATDFAKCLKTHPNFSGFDVQVLTDDNDDETLARNQIFEGLSWLFNGAQSGDVLVLFISGHCELNESNNIVSLVTVEDEFTHFLIPSTVFLGYFKGLPSGCVVEVFIDCCHGSGLIKLPHVIQQMDSSTVEGSSNMSSSSSNVSALPTITSVTSIVSEPSTSHTTTRPPPPHPPMPQVAATSSHPNRGASAAVRMGQASPAVHRPAPSISHISYGVTAGLGPMPTRTALQISPYADVDPIFFSKAPPHAPRGSNPPIVVGPRFRENVETRASVVVWAASRVEEEAFESSGGSRNGVLSAAICKVLERHGAVTRQHLWDEVTRIAREENNRRLEHDPRLQHPQILSSSDDAEIFMTTKVFQAPRR